jgi:hypothetical protein
VVGPARHPTRTVQTWIRSGMASLEALLGRIAERLRGGAGAYTNVQFRHRTVYQSLTIVQWSHAR